MKNIISLISFFILASNLASNAFADQGNKTKDEKDYKLFDSTIFSLSKKNENAFDVPSSIFVLSSEEIRRSGATSIPEVLRLVPGLQVARIDGHKWAISARGFNSQFSNKLLIMIDGRTIYTPVFSGVLWDVQDYPLADIEKIEVIRGSGGAIWGANAVNGIINIITKNTIDTQDGYASITAGTQDNLAEIRYGGKNAQKDHYRFYANKREAENFHNIKKANNQDGYGQSQAGFRYDIRSIAKNNITISGDIRQGNADGYFDFNTLPDGSMDKKSQGGNLLINWQKTISPKSSFTLQSYLDYDQFEGSILERDGRTADVDFQHFYDLSEKQQINWGLGYRLIKDYIKETALSNNVIPLDYAPNNQNNSIYSAFLQDKITLTDKAILTIGSKFESNSYTGFEYQPSAKISIYPAKNQTAWASISRAVRTPTRGENGLVVSYPDNGFDLQINNTDYGSENVVSYEIGYRIKPNYKSLIDVALFYNDYNKLRTFDASSRVVKNLGEGESFGAELTAKWKATPKWRLEAGYDFLKINLKMKNGVADSASFPLVADEGTAPKNQFRLRSNYNLTPKIEFDNIAYYIDSLSMAGSSATQESAKKVPSYIRLDTRLGYLLNQNVDLSVGVQNITDRRHKEFKNGTFSNITEVGRTAYFKTTIRF